MGNEIYNYPGFGSITVKCQKNSRSYLPLSDADSTELFTVHGYVNRLNGETLRGAGQGEIGDGSTRAVPGAP